jgi:hypothetical protein
VIAIPMGVLQRTKGCVRIDLVEPGAFPNSIHRQGRQIYRKEIHREGSP